MGPGFHASDGSGVLNYRGESGGIAPSDQTQSLVKRAERNQSGPPLTWCDVAAHRAQLVAGWGVSVAVRRV